MKIHRFFLKEYVNKGAAAFQLGATIEILDEGLIHQWEHVLRFKEGDDVSVFTGDGKEYQAKFFLLKKGKCSLLIVVELPSASTQRHEVTLISSVIRKDRYEWLLEKGTELGAKHFYPVITERSDERGSYRKDRFEKIIIEAAEQSGQQTLPEIHEVATMNSVAAELLKRGYKLYVADFEGRPILEEFGQELRKKESMKIAFLIGPEGGWGDEDGKFFAGIVHTKISLGSSVLRAETAGIVALSSVILST